MPDDSTSTSTNDWQQQSNDAIDSSVTDTAMPDTSMPANPVQPTSFDDDSSNSTNDLLDIKTKALSQLSPLVNHLDQSPEEKFKTTMMMIQASDNQALIKDAYEAAQQITDEKVKAQALLDVINEINYFTRQSGQ
jgi:hypothetical protein